MNITLPESMRGWIGMQEIDQLLIDGLQSGEPIEIGEYFWSERRQALEERMIRSAKERAS